MIKMQK